MENRKLKEGNGKWKIEMKSGIHAKNSSPIGHFFSSIGHTTAKLFVFCSFVRVCLPKKYFHDELDRSDSDT